MSLTVAITTLGAVALVVGLVNHFLAVRCSRCEEPFADHTVAGWCPEGAHPKDTPEDLLRMAEQQERWLDDADPRGIFGSAGADLMDAFLWDSASGVRKDFSPESGDRAETALSDRR